jgi:fermentation-respiration switch protein FrsA (DUF1100 family)
MQEEKIRFFSDGLALRGALVLPDGQGPFPGVVLCQGLGSTWERNAQPDLAQLLSEQGIASLMFNHRGLGDSEGERGYIYPWYQARDVRDAITFLSGHPKIADSAVGLSGASFGGANAIVVAATDPRVKVVFAASTFADGVTWMRDIRRYWEWQEFVGELEADRRRQAEKGQSQMVPLDRILVRDPEGQRYAKEMEKTFGPREPVPLELAARILEYHPGDFVARVAPRPLLLVHGSDDRMIPVDEVYRLAERAGEGSGLEVLEGAGHYNLYSTFLPRYSELLVDFFRTHLASG